jgi:hypothetical protein
MAYVNLEPYRDEILALRKPGPNQKTLTEVAEHLRVTHGLRTTPGTLSRYLKDLRQTDSVPSAQAAERDRADTLDLLTELLDLAEEHRLAMEALAAQVAIQNHAIAALEQNRAQRAQPLLHRLWCRVTARRLKERLVQKSTSASGS